MLTPSPASSDTLVDRLICSHSFLSSLLARLCTLSLILRNPVVRLNRSSRTLSLPRPLSSTLPVDLSQYDPVHIHLCLLPLRLALPNITRKWQHQSKPLQKRKLQRRRCTDGHARVGLSGVHDRCALTETDLFQVALLADYGGRSVRKANQLAKLASIWACDATTSGQCGGAMASIDDSKRR